MILYKEDSASIMTVDYAVLLLLLL